VATHAPPFQTIDGHTVFDDVGRDYDRIANAKSVFVLACRQLASATHGGIWLRRL